MSDAAIRSIEAPYSVIDNAVTELNHLAEKVATSIDAGDHVATLGALEALGVCRFYLGGAITALIGCSTGPHPSGQTEPDDCDEVAYGTYI